MAVTKADVLAIVNAKTSGFVLEIHPDHMWQDTSQTTAAVVDSQVSYLVDQSNHGYDFTRAGALGASAPFLRQDVDGSYYLENANSGASPTGFVSTITGQANVGAVIGNKPYAILSALSGMDNSDEFYFSSSVPSSSLLNDDAIHVGQRNVNQLTVAHWFNDANFSVSAGTISGLQLHTAKFLNPGSKYFIDGVEEGNNATTPSALGTDFDRLSFYCRQTITGSTSSAAHFYGRFYGAVVAVLGDSLTAQEQADIEEWIGIQAGTIIPTGTTYNVTSSVTARATSTAQAFAQTPVTSAVTAWATGDITTSATSLVQLFTAGQEGAFFNLADLSTLFQDSARTIPVTTDGDLIGGITDLSGNGRHWTNTGADRVIYRTDGHHHWFEVDNSGLNNQNLQTPDFAISGEAMIFAGFLSEVPETAFRTYARWEGSGLDDRRISLNSNNSNQGRVRVDTESDVNITAGNQGALDEKAVYGWGVQNNVPVYQRRAQIQNGEDIEVTGPALTGTIADTGFVRFGFTTTGKVRCYGLLIRDGALTLQEQDEIKEFFAWNTGTPVEVQAPIEDHPFTDVYTFDADTGNLVAEREVTIPAPNTVDGYSQWLTDVSAYRTFGDDKTEIRPAAEGPFGSDFFRCNIPAGTSSPSDLGSNNSGSQWLADFFNANHAWLRYQVRFGTGFDWVKGGKLPGLLGGDAPTGGGLTTAGFTTRMMWRENGQGELYAYFYNKDSLDGESIGRGEFTFTDNTWYTIEQEVKLNTVDPDTGTVFDDGYVRIWVDGVPAFEIGRMVFRDTNAVTITGIISSIFFGGTGVTWRSTKDEDVDTGNFQVWVSDEVSTTVPVSASVTAKATSTGQAFAQTPVSSANTARAVSLIQAFTKAYPSGAISARSTQTSTLTNTASATATATAVATSFADFIITGSAQIEELWADAHLAGTVTNPANALGVTDGVFTTDSGPTNWTSRWSMENPANTPTGEQTIKIIARTDNPTGNTPTIDSVNLYENGVLVQQVIGSTPITAGTSGQELVGTFDASAIVNGDLVEIEIVTTGQGGPPASRSAVQIDSINWEASTVGAITYNVTASVTAKAVSSAQVDAFTPVSASIAARATSSAQAFAQTPVSSAVPARATSTGQAFARTPVSATVTAKATSTATAPIQAAVSSAITARATSAGQAIPSITVSSAVMAQATSSAQAFAKAPVSSAIVARATSTGQAFALTPVSATATARATSTGQAFTRTPVSATATARATQVSNCVIASETSAAITARAVSTATNAKRSPAQSAVSARATTTAAFDRVSYAAGSTTGVSVSSANATVISDVIVPVSSAVSARAVVTGANEVYHRVSVSATAAGSATSLSAASRKTAATSSVTAKASQSSVTTVRLGLKASASAVSNSQAILSFVAFMAPSEAVARASAAAFLRGRLPNNEAPSKRQVFVSRAERSIIVPESIREIHLYSVK